MSDEDRAEVYKPGTDAERYEDGYEFDKDPYRIWGRCASAAALLFLLCAGTTSHRGRADRGVGCCPQQTVGRHVDECVPPPAAGPARRGPGAFCKLTAAAFSAVQSTMNVMAVVVCSAAFIALKFMLIPLTLAYFVTFLQAPILDLFEKRPMSLGQKPTEATKDLPEDQQEFEEKLLCNNILDEKRLKLPREERGNGSLKGMAIDCIVLGKSPHMLGVLFTLIACVVGLGAIGSIIGGSLASFAADQQELVDNGGQPMGEALAQMGNEQMAGLKDMGVNLYRGEYCTFQNNSNYKMQLGEKDLAPRYKAARDPDTDMDTHKNSDLVATINVLNVWNYVKTPKANCTMMDIFWMPNDAGIPQGYDMSNYPGATGADYRGEGQTYDELMATVNSVSLLLNDVVLILLLSLYILMERPEGRTVSGDHAIMEEVEDLIKNYINLKTGISAFTGVLVWIFLFISSTPLAAVWGLLSFLLNFIPNVGSAMAIVLPLPIILLAPVEVMTGTDKAIAILGPTTVQAIVGNALEPALFGAALNLTALSILLALVIFAAVWGLPGAVLSVPFLGIMKVVAHHTDHPQAKALLMMIREDVEVDKQKDADWAKLRAQRAAREEAEAQAMLDAETALGFGAGYGGAEDGGGDDGKDDADAEAQD